MERWAYVAASGAVVGVELERIDVGATGDPRWRSAPSHMWSPDAAACVRAVAAARGDVATQVLGPVALCAHGRVTLSLSRESACAWRRLLAQWSAIGTLGEPGEELARELAAALGEGRDDG